LTISAPKADKRRNEAPEITEKQRIPGQVSILSAFLCVALTLYSVLMAVAPRRDQPVGLFILVWGGCFLLYVVACIWIMKTRPLRGRGVWLELGIIFGGALVFRVMLLNLVPGLSPDAWRYLWDGRVILHGYNPYVYAPADKMLLLLRDNVYVNADYRLTPTAYPPVAELFFLLGALMMPTHLLATKALFVGCDLVTCIALALLLARKEMDPRRVLIYAWCPLPIVEYALEGHVDAVPIMFTVLAILCSVGLWRGARVWAGIFLGLATLAKIYPIILLLAIVRRKDWPLLVACVLTIALGYFPFMLFSNGHLLAAPLSFINQGARNPSVLPTLFFFFEHHLFHANLVDNSVVVAAVDVLVLVPSFLLVVVQRVRGRLSLEIAVLILIGSFMAASAFVFPWYAAAFLPWLALLIGPVWDVRGFHVSKLALILVWYFTAAVIFCYVLGPSTTNWLLYFGATSGVVLLGCILAAFGKHLLHQSQATTRL